MEKILYSKFDLLTTCLFTHLNVNLFDDSSRTKIFKVPQNELRKHIHQMIH